MGAREPEDGERGGVADQPQRGRTPGPAAGGAPTPTRAPGKATQTAWPSSSSGSGTRGGRMAAACSCTCRSGDFHLFSLTLALSRWEREGAPPPSRLSARAGWQRRGLRGLLSQRERNEVREKGRCVLLHSHVTRLPTALPHPGPTRWEREALRRLLVPPVIYQVAVYLCRLPMGWGYSEIAHGT